MNFSPNAIDHPSPSDEVEDSVSTKGRSPASGVDHRPVMAMIGASDIEIWGLTTEERLRRTTKKMNVQAVLKDGEPWPGTGSVVLIRADYAVEDRLVKALVDHAPGIVLGTDEGSGGPSRTIAAAHVEAVMAEATAELLRSGSVDPEQVKAEALALLSPIELGGDYNAQLRKREVPYVLEVGPKTTATIENRIFAGAYKGITDFVTKYCWPLPARYVTRQAVKFGWSPNMVTAASLVLVFVTLWLFMQGYFLTGLAVGWFMTFLDTVDGKLARVTLTSSPWGNIFDHGIDLIHPPFWYWAWWYGLHQTVPEAAAMPYLDLALMVVVIGYIVGRVEEGIFLHSFGIQIHIWRPIDSFFRQITARRNPNLFILMMATLLGAPVLGFLLIAVWTILSIAFHALRIVQAFFQRGGEGIVSHLAKPLDAKVA